MKSRYLVAGVFLAAVVAAQQWEAALPGYAYQFPRDHFAHMNYQSEWWYYTGHLRAADGHRYGFELTFFRSGVRLPEAAAQSIAAVWRPDQLYLAHLALTDIDGKEFYHTERLNRAGPGLAGVSFEDRRYWNGAWQVRWTRSEQDLEAVSDRVRLHLHLQPVKAFVLNGENGIIQKGPRVGDASHYISFTRLIAKGELNWKNKQLAVNGLAWMDHEFFTEPPDSSLAGWDWFSAQLDNNEELMIYRLHLKSGPVSTYSSGTYVDSAGHAHVLKASDFSLHSGGEWQSPASGARYPLTWTISVPCLGLKLNQQPLLKNQELFSSRAISPTYWEGAVAYEGRSGAKPIHGSGYLEMTGYDRAVRLSP
jgi:predicted secreted hydrolase